MTKELKEKAIKLKGKDYVQVVDRVQYFNENYTGNINTEILHVFDGKKGKIYVVKTTVTYTDKDGLLYTRTGLSQAEMGESGANMTAALENAETSAVGRALGFMGIGVIDSIASADELHKAGVKATKSPETNENMGVCSLCGTEAKISPKSGKEYCPKWNEETHKNGAFYKIVSKTEKEFTDGLEVIER